MMRLKSYSKDLEEFKMFIIPIVPPILEEIGIIPIVPPILEETIS